MSPLISLRPHVGSLSTTSSLSTTAVPPPPVRNFTKQQPASSCLDNGFRESSLVVIQTERRKKIKK